MNAKRPLMVNNMHLKNPLFVNAVNNCIDFAESNNGSNQAQWDIFIAEMQKCIRHCGKFLACKNRVVMQNARDTLAHTRRQGNARQLTAEEEVQIGNCLHVLQEGEQKDASKARFLSRKLALSDTDCITKDFFKKVN